MKGPAALAFAAVAGAGALTVFSVGRASDHLDGPRATGDSQSDITDVFAFTSPEDPTKVVLAMAVTPYASDASTFSGEVDYAFRVQRVDALQPFTLDGVALDVMCELGDGDGAGPTMTCTGPRGSSASAVVGSGPSAAGEPVRVFAGLRSDPAFFDRQGALASVASGRASFTGQNAFAGTNVLAIVVEMNASLFASDGGASPVLAVAAETVRRGP